MFDIGWSELLVIAVVAIVVVGPKELPKLLRTFGYYAGKLRRAAAEFRRQFDDAMREAELEEVKKAIESVRTETASLDETAPLNKRFMPPTLEERPQLVEPEAVKPPPEPPRKRAAPKTKSPAKRAKSGAEPSP